MGKSPFWPCYHFEIHQTFPMEVHSRHSSIGHVNMNHKHPLVKKKNGKIIIKVKISFWMHGSLICGKEYMECEKRISIIN